jgi:hypothetical protein
MRKIRVIGATTLTGFLLLIAVFAIAGDNKNKKPTPEDTLYGTITCSIPAPPPPPKATGTPADTVDLCLARKGLIMIINPDDRTSMAIENPDTVKGYEGHKISVSGYLNGATFHVVSLRIL